MTEREIIVGEERAPLAHETQVRSLPLIRTHLPVLAGLPAREGNKIRFAKEDVHPFGFRLERGVRGAELVSALFSAGFEGLPLSRLEGNGVFLYVVSPTPPGKDPFYTSRMRFPASSLLVKLRNDGLQFLRVPAGLGGEASAPEVAARLDGAASPGDISATLDKLCSASAPCSPFGVNPGPESTAGLFIDLLTAMAAREEFASPSSPPPRALVLRGDPKHIPVTAPGKRMGNTRVNGRLPAETIRKIVRASFGEYRKCYEAGLEKEPTLQGEVRMRFVIARDGKVSATRVAPESTMPDEAVSYCVQEAFSKLIFPQPEGGIVTVTYPIQFSPE